MCVFTGDSKGLFTSGIMEINMNKERYMRVFLSNYLKKILNDTLTATGVLRTQ